ncbi:ribonuclease H [Senna tora]|uniref:Ribonuclease H n=1 Tax=Senna tora TaxID=362788 RepID=A0A834TH48_9FABA|nr:ribonuclease H [Senna tora]
MAEAGEICRVLCDGSVRRLRGGDNDRQQRQLWWIDEINGGGSDGGGEIFFAIIEFVDNSSQWKLDEAKDWLPDDIKRRLNEITPPSALLGPDAPILKHDLNGRFMVKSAYNVISNFPNESRTVWKQIWKANSIPRNKLLLWRLGHDRLPTNSRVASWSNKSPLCPFCERKIEVESDSKVAVNSIQSNLQADRSEHPILEEIRKLFQCNWEILLKLIPMSINTCADLLAKDSLASPRGLVLLESPPLLLRM